MPKVKELKREFFNLDKLIKIEVWDKEENPRIHYFEKQKGFFNRLLNGDGGYFRSRYYNNEGFSYKEFSKEELQSGKIHGIYFIVEKNKVFYRPKVVLIFQGEIEEKVSFENLVQAEVFADEIKNKLEEVGKTIYIGRR